MKLAEKAKMKLVKKAKLNKKWYEENSEYHRLYYEQNAKIREANNRAYEKRNPERKKAYQTLYRALKKGIVTRPNKCQMCAKECKPEGHHHDYSKLLEVIWVCRKCHLEIHRQHTFKERSNAVKVNDGDLDKSKVN